jgi:hypothetical protein
VVLSSVTTPPLIGNKTRLLRPLKGAFAKYHDGFFGRDFAPCRGAKQYRHFCEAILSL